MKVKTVKVKLDPSTLRWLRAFAKVNSKTQLNSHNVTPAKLLGEAAFCLADSAGRHHGWRADLGGSMLLACGFQEKIPLSKLMRLQTQDRRAK